MTKLCNHEACMNAPSIHHATTGDTSAATITREDELICLGHREGAAAPGGQVGQACTRSVPLATPIVPTSLFAFPTMEALMVGLAEEHRQPVYTRGMNPTVAAVEHALAGLEQGEACKCVASGMAAVSMVLFGLLEAGDHLLFVNQIYGPTLELATRLERFGIHHDVAFDLEPETIASAIQPSTRLLWIESPGTMMFRCADLRAIAKLAQAHGITTVIDNSWATPLFQKPLTHGIDLVVHSATKYLAGHSDVVVGAVVASQALLDRLFFDSYLLLGGALSPFDAFLVGRGLKTLPVRMRRHHTSAIAVARFLAQHDQVRAVHHPTFDPASAATLTGFSGLFSFVVDGGYARAAEVIDRLRHFRIGVSWGGVESLAITPRPATHETASSLPPGLIRLSIGLEDPDVLIEDLDRALRRESHPGMAAMKEPS